MAKICGVLLGTRHVMIIDQSELNQFDPGALELTRLFKKDLGLEFVFFISTIFSLDLCQFG